MPVSPSSAFMSSGVTSEKSPTCAWTEKRVLFVFQTSISSSVIIYLIFLNGCLVETVVKIRV